MSHHHHCLEDLRALWDRPICLYPVSKNVRGDLRLLEREHKTRR